jgi:lipoyl(octanoyl) transferase
MEKIVAEERKLFYCDLGFIDYKEAWDLQKKIFEARKANIIPDALLLLEHNHVYTLGKTASYSNLIWSKEFLEKNKISVYEIDRGGDITYHGPGQLVAYPIINLSDWKQDAHLYLRTLEEVAIKVCNDFGLNANRIEKLTGVWIKDRKICAVGIKISSWITMHGIAFNVNTNLDLFNGIIPCGITDKAVTSLSKELGYEIEMSKFKEIYLSKFIEVFNYDFTKQIEKEFLLSL